MRKSLVILLLLLITGAAFGQKKSIVNLVKSESSTGFKVGGRQIIKVYKGTFQQDYSTLTSDSAYFYPQENAFDAFGHVDINQGDTLNVYSDKLNYNGNTKIAILTDNVRLVDKDATLTTNHLTYNTATRIGTYTDGGKLVNKDNTLVSKNGYYFAYTRDSYFRYNVSLRTPDALVVTDTMRYNTGSKICYFYGPTNIYSTKKEKDRDTLYTENGTYDTKIEQAAFGKNNLYHSGTKSLRGDSLFYDKLKGYGRAVGHVVSEDKEQKTTIKGGLGIYTKADERTLVTIDPYVTMVVDQKDTTKTDSAAKADSVAKAVTSAKKDSSAKGRLTSTADSLRQKQPGRAVMNMAQVIKNTIPVKTDTTATNRLKAAVRDTALQKKAAAGLDKLKRNILPPKGSMPLKLDSLTGRKAAEKASAMNDTARKKTDTIYMSADTIETRIMAYKDYKVYLAQQYKVHHPDTTKKIILPQLKETKLLRGWQIDIQHDTSYRMPYFFGKPKPKIVEKKPLSKKQLERDSLMKVHIADSIRMAKLAEPPDTARIRILLGYHHFKMFKSDLQAKADSMFYNSVDSTIRCYIDPMMWAEGSQLSGDTIYLKMKHRKLYSMRMFPHAFIVNVEKEDSTHYNQVAGKQMLGYFSNNKLKRIIINGNAESIYFVRDSAKNTIQGMQRSLSTSISADFENNKVVNMGFYEKPENTYGPLSKFSQDDMILKGFIWKPKERPVSKEAILPSYNRKRMPAKPKKKGENKKGKEPPEKKTAGQNATGDTPPPTKETAGSPKTASGTMPKTDSVKTVPARVLKPDSTRKDSTVKKQNQ